MAIAARMSASARSLPAIPKASAAASLILWIGIGGKPLAEKRDGAVAGELPKRHERCDTDSGVLVAAGDRLELPRRSPSRRIAELGNVAQRGGNANFSGRPYAFRFERGCGRAMTAAENDTRHPRRIAGSFNDEGPPRRQLLQDFHEAGAPQPKGTRIALPSASGDRNIHCRAETPQCFVEGNGCGNLDTDQLALHCD